MITLIVARAANGAIGRDGTIPWHIPADLQLFKRETLGGALVMGRRTWDSLPVRPLPSRLNVVVSSRAEVADHVMPSVAAAVEFASADHQRIYGIGGARIYSEMLPLAHRLLISEVDIDVPDADTFFPPVDDDAWEVVAERPLQTDGPRCVLREYLRRN